MVAHTPLGPLQGVAGLDGVTGLGWRDGRHPPAPEDPVDDDPHGLQAALAAYFDGDLVALDRVPLDPAGTEIQRRVWAALRRVPAGEVTTYGALAVELGLGRGGARAVGAAAGANPLALLVPCHRVRGADGGLVGFAWGVDRKRWLLRHEGVAVGPEQQSLFG